MTARTVILMVEDQAGVRALARRILEPAGYLVIEAANGFDAITLVDGGLHVDLLMADLDMPVLRGDEMVRRLRAADADLKVLYVTAHIDSLMEERPVLWQGEAFLEKPYTPAGLLEAVSLLMFGTIDRGV